MRDLRARPLRAAVIVAALGLAACDRSSDAGGPRGKLPSKAPVSAAAQATPAWDPANTRVFVVCLAWFKGESPEHSSFTLEDRNDGALVGLFESRGVPAKNITFLEDAAATTAGVRAALTAALAASKPGETLIFYYGSHGGYDPKAEAWRFSTFDGSIPMTWARETIDAEFRGARALLLSDSCYSGGLVALAEKPSARVAYAAISSTYRHNVAWSAWRFIDALMRGFGGSNVVDADADGYVTLGELGRFTERHMAFVAEGKPELFMSPGFSKETRIASVSKPKKDERIGRYVKAEWHGAWYKAEVEDADGARVKVHYTSYDHKSDEWLGPERVKEPDAPRFAPGDKVEAQASGSKKWYPAKVLERWEAMHLVHWDGYSSAYDEWMGPSRIR